MDLPLTALNQDSSVEQEMKQRTMGKIDSFWSCTQMVQAATITLELRYIEKHRTEI